MKRTGSLSVLALALSATAALASPRRTVVVDSNGTSLVNGALADTSPHEILKVNPRSPAQLAPAADTRILFMNNCMPNGCPIKTGNPDNRTQTSDLADFNGTLTAWKWGQPVWDATMACMKNVFSRFNVQIVDVDPGPNTPHYEIVNGGTASQIMNNAQGTLGIADISCGQIGVPNQCDPYIPNALVFSFGNDPYYTQNTADEVCATAAQEIAHTWALDHVVDASDPMTYNSFSGIRQYKDGQKCGSDCQGGQSPFGLQCSAGSDQTATHTCMLGASTQNEVQTITALFGPSSTSPPPTVSITSPTANATVAPGFSVDVNCTAPGGGSVASVELAIDTTAVGTVTSAPFTFTAPTTLGTGAHHVTATCTTAGGGTAEASVDVTEAMSGCTSPANCPNPTDTCVAGACVAGSGAPGGLGTACTNSAQCISGSCASDGTSMYCVVSCDPTMQACPSGFGCTAVGAAGTSGVCWPGADSGGGGGCTTGSGGGEILFGLGFAGLLLARRRR